MRLFITLTTLLFLSTQLQAQITIERSDYTLEEGREVNWNLDYSNASPPEEGEGMVWDFSDLPLGNGFFFDYVAASSAEFPEANLKGAITRSILGGLAERPGEEFYLLDDTGRGPVGGIYEPTAVPLALLTGGATDTLKVLRTVEDFMGRKANIQFPLNYGDTWAYDISSDADFLISVAAFGVQNAPAGQITRDSAVASVSSYGTLILPNPSGIGSVSMDVLMVKRVRKVVFTYTLGGQPAPQVMLDALGLEQGESQDFTRYFFYAKGLPRSAANIRVNGNGEIDLFTIPDEIKNIVSSTSKVAAEPVQVTAFPNPASGSFQLAFDKPDAQDWTVELHNALGQMVHRQVIAGGAGATHADVLLPNLPAGLHHYVLRSRTGMVMASGSVVLK